MQHRCVNGEHNVQLLDDRRYVGEVGLHGACIDNLFRPFGLMQLLGRFTHMQAVQFYPGVL